MNSVRSMVMPVTRVGMEQLTVVKALGTSRATATLLSLRSYYTLMSKTIGRRHKIADTSMRKLFMIVSEVYLVCAGTSRHPTPITEDILGSLIHSEIVNQMASTNNWRASETIELAGLLSDLYLSQPYISHALISGHPVVNDQGYDTDIEGCMYYAPASWCTGSGVLQLRTLRCET